MATSVPSILRAGEGSFADIIGSGKKVNDFWAETIRNSGGTFQVTARGANGSTRVTHMMTKSSRQGIDYQLTYFDKKGIPQGHTDIRGSLKDDSVIRKIISDLPKSDSEQRFEVSAGSKGNSRSAGRLRAKATSGAKGR